MLSVFFSPFPVDDPALSQYVSSLRAAAASYLDKELDWDHEGVDRHLNRIADHMIDWEVKLSTLMNLTFFEISDLKANNSADVCLQRYSYT